MESNLPGYNCKQCGYDTCDELSVAIKAGKKNTCTFIKDKKKAHCKGVLVKEDADFILHPLKDMGSCIEYILPLGGKKLRTGDLVRYRPCGCPITHFARVLGYTEGILKIEMVGPLGFIKGETFIELGICLVLGFEGTIVEGEVPEVGQTVRFIPHKCMMQKVHSGIIVAVNKRNVRIEGIDLKVWGLPK
jgi:uncharacterized Fe-S cluster-containing protein